MAVDLTIAKQWVKEQDAEMITYRVASFGDSEEILRGWPANKIPRDKRNMCKDYLVSFGSEKNDKLSNFITDPQADREVWNGTWQHFFEGWQLIRGQEYLTQTIRRGYYHDIAYQTSEIGSDKTVQTRQQLGLTTETVEPMAAVDGQVKSQQVVFNTDDRSLAIHSHKDVGVPQEIVNTINSPSETIVINKKTVQTAPLDVPALEDGILRRIQSVWSRYFNRWDTTEEVDIGIPQETKSIVETGMVKSITTEKTVQSPGLIDPVAPINDDMDITHHKIQHVTNAPSKYPGMFTTTLKEDQPKHLSIPEYVVHIGERETVYHSEEKHDPKMPDIMKFKAKNNMGGIDNNTIALDANGHLITQDSFGGPVNTGGGMDVSILSHDLDDFLTHNYKKSRTVRKFPFDGTLTWLVYGETETISVQSVQAFLNKTGPTYVEYNYTYQTVYTHTMKYFRSAQEAIDYIAWADPITHIPNPPTSILPDDPNADGFSSGIKTKYDPNNQSRWSHTGESEWEAIRVAISHSLRYTYHYPDPSL